MVIESKIDSFIGNISLGVSFFETAGNQLVAMIDEEPGICERIIAMKRVEWLTKDVLDTFEAIGRKQLAVEAMFLPKHVLERMISLPLETQAAIATKPVTVYREAKRRSTDAAVTKPASELTRKEAALAIGPNGLRSLVEQGAVTHKESLIVEPDRTIAFVALTMISGRVFAKRVEKVPRAQKVKLDLQGTVFLEIVV